MKWFYKKDKTNCIITAQKNIDSNRKTTEKITLPKNAVVFCMSKWDTIIEENYDYSILTQKLPRFLGTTKVYTINNKKDWCFLHGGAGGPQIADTVETLNAYGVKNIVLVGLAGGFGQDVMPCDVVLVSKILCEEGTSLHYKKYTPFSKPNSPLDLDKVISELTSQSHKAYTGAVVTTDACYRQSVFKETSWLKKGCVCVEMESSAFTNVCNVLGITNTTFLFISDKHTLNEEANWKWAINKTELRQNFIKSVINIVTNKKFYK